MRYGINFHPIKKPAADDATQFAIMRLRNWQVARLDLPMAADTDATLVPRMQGLVSLARDNGVYLLPILCTPFTWGDRTDNNQYPAGDAAALYQQGYNRTKAIATIFRNDMRDWELNNEINLLMRDAAGSQLYGKGWYANEFSGPVMEDWAQVLKGCSDAIDWVNTTYGTSLRRVLNTTSTMLGFLDFMASRGVKFEVVDLHIYPKEGDQPWNEWANFNAQSDGHHVGAWNLYQTLGTRFPNCSFIIGEVNASEVYKPTYTNTEGDPDTEMGFKSFRHALQYAATQPYLGARLEAVYAYELLDDPDYTGTPEGRFGMYAGNTPKIPALLLANRSGGHLCAPELARLTSRNLQSL